MNTTEKPFTTEKKAPVCLDDLASDHYFRMTHLRDMLAHLERFTLEEISPNTEGVETLQALIFGALELARQATGEADRLWVNNAPRRHLMDMPEDMAEGLQADTLDRVTRALRVMTAADAEHEELTEALVDVHSLAGQKVGIAPEDMQAFGRLAELRGYGMGWLIHPDGSLKPHISPSLSTLASKVQSQDEATSHIRARGNFLAERSADAINPEEGSAATNKEEATHEPA